MPNVILYTLNESAPCRIVQMTLSVLNLKHEEVTVDLFSGEHKTPEYLEVSFPCHLFSFSWVMEFYFLDKKLLLFTFFNTNSLLKIFGEAARFSNGILKELYCHLLLRPELLKTKRHQTP